MMVIKTHEADSVRIAEIISDRIILKDAEDGVELLGNIYYQGFDRLILHEKNIAKDFFDLKSGIAGEILQKFSTYRIKLAIVGSFDAYSGNSFRAFVIESNRTGNINFAESVSEAVIKLSPALNSR
jgi:hypothetical protein